MTAADLAAGTDLLGPAIALLAAWALLAWHWYRNR